MSKIPMRDMLKELKKIPQQKLDDIRFQAQGASEMKVIKMIMEEEKWTYEEAVAACTADDERRVPKYALYWKLAYPGIMINIKNRKKIQPFIDSLPEDERKIFEEEFDPKTVKKAYRKGTKDGVKNALKGKM